MSIIKSTESRNYTVISNKFIEDDRHIFIAALEQLQKAGYLEESVQQEVEK